MPYHLEKVGHGFKVCDDTRCFSKKPLTKKQSKKQIIAIALSESRKTGKPVKNYFV